MPKLIFDISEGVDKIIEDEVKRQYDKWFKSTDRQGPRPSRASVGREIFERGFKKVRK